MKIDPNLKKEIKRIFFQKIKEERKEKVTIITPYPINDQEKEMFYQYLPWLRNKILVNEVNPDLIGGFIIRIGSDIFDGSILGKINNLLKKIDQSI